MYIFFILTTECLLYQSGHLQERDGTLKWVTGDLWRWANYKSVGRAEETKGSHWELGIKTEDLPSKVQGQEAVTRTRGSYKLWKAVMDTLKRCRKGNKYLAQMFFFPLILWKSCPLENFWNCKARRQGSPHNL